MQEQGREADWESVIKKINSAFTKKEIIPYSEEQVTEDILMRFYHWKYNSIPLPTPKTLTLNLEANKQ